jgi:hypothetical protein
VSGVPPNLTRRNRHHAAHRGPSPPGASASARGRACPEDVIRKRPRFEGLKVRRLFAGGNWIRTIGTRKIRSNASRRTFVAALPQVETAFAGTFFLVLFGTPLPFSRPISRASWRAANLLAQAIALVLAAGRRSACWPSRRQAVWPIASTLPKQSSTFARLPRRS